MRNAYRILVKKSEPLRRSRRSWKDNIKINIKETGWGVMDWLDLAQDGDQWSALANTVMNLRIP
jgi:hypothetical protein